MKNDRGLPILFDKLNELALDWCSWKNNHELESALNGGGDIDILIDGRRWRSVRVALYESGFTEFENTFMNYPYVHHFYGPGEDGRILHLHVYRRVITGESQTKAYDLPISHLIFASISEDHGVKVPSRMTQKKRFLIRYFIKIGSVYSIARTYIDRRDYAEEYRQLHDVRLDGERWLGVNFEELDRAYQKTDWLRSIILSFRLKKQLSGVNRFRVIELLLFRHYQVFYRLLNKLIFHHKKRLISGGLTLAVVGLDGAGKTTSVAYLARWLGRSFDVRLYHLGKPRSSLVGLPFNIGLWCVKKGFSLRPRTARTGSSTVGDGPIKMGILVALRYLVLARDRAVLAKRANHFKAKGGIVIFDRFPSNDFGKMDSPRIPLDSPIRVVRKLAAMERAIYQAIPCPDVLIRLVVPVEVAVSRNQDRVKADKETDEEIRARHQFNGVLNYRADKFYVVDMNRTIASTTLDLRNIFWAEVN